MKLFSSMDNQQKEKPRLHRINFELKNFHFCEKIYIFMKKFS